MSTRGTGPATLDEVAREASVSRATASRVVNGDRRVSQPAREAVEAAVRDLGYVPNRAARSLVTRRSDSVAVVIPEPSTQLFGDPFFPRVLRGMSDALASESMQLVLLMPQARGDAGRIERYLEAGHTDGVLLVSMHGADPLLGGLLRHGVPLVVGGRPFGQGISYVDVDNRGGASSAVRHLVEIGRRRVATIAGPQDMAAGADRLAGYHETLAEAGLATDTALVEIADFTLDGGRAAMERLLGRAPGLDAVFVASDLMAVGAIAALTAAGRAIPADVAIVGFDDSQLATTTQPNLSSVRQPIEEMGREMARLLVEEIRFAGRAPRRVILDTQLVLRASSIDGAEAGIGI
ncbi:MAG TPA: LacI family DNA-binding transcriptional regulator [Candidatus Limnocylindria bacterium]|nr:LacI family DNA-binding transcriptional regulator [Candidatus Limnocylindria bacterium]